MATILSHPLTGNYGGMLQAYALTKTIHSVRLNVLYWDYEPDDLKQLFHSPLSRLKELVRILLYRARQSEFCPYSTKKENYKFFQISLEDVSFNSKWQSKIESSIYCR